MPAIKTGGPTIVPAGFVELSPTDVYQKGDLYWSINKKQWMPTDIRVGKSNSMWKTPGIRLALPKTGSLGDPKEIHEPGENFEFIREGNLQHGDFYWSDVNGAWAPVPANGVGKPISGLRHYPIRRASIEVVTEMVICHCDWQGSWEDTIRTDQLGYDYPRPLCPECRSDKLKEIKTTYRKPRRNNDKPKTEFDAW